MPSIEAERFLDTHFKQALSADTIYDAAMLVYDDEKIAVALVKKHETAKAL